MNTEKSSKENTKIISRGRGAGAPLVELGKSILNDFQLGVFKECVKKRSGGMSIPLGAGKTLLGTLVGLELTKDADEPILAVMSLTLIESWVDEIKKFFGDGLKYIIFHKTYIKKIDVYVVPDDVKLVITTPQVLAKAYKDNDVVSKFTVNDIINEGMFNQHFIKRYVRPKKPFLNIKMGLRYLFSIKWGCLLVDEIQKYTKITTLQCQALGAVCSDFRWGLSGKMFAEPTIERIFGFYIIIDYDNFPRTLPMADKFVKSSLYGGYNEAIVHRRDNPCFIPPKVNQCIISHKLSYEEEMIYRSMKTTMNIVDAKLKRYKFNGDIDNSRKFSSYLLSVLCYLRQCVVCPILPIANVAIDMSDFQCKSELSKIILLEIRKLNIGKWLEDENSAKSTRMQEALNVIDKHISDNIVVFSCFRTTIDIFTSFLTDKDRNVYSLTSSMSAMKRSETINKFRESNKNGKGNILLLTYEIGAEGLNLQCSNTVLLLDFWWNSGKSEQSIARVLRFGQLAPVVNIYMFTSNTAIENALFEKQDMKLTIINELSTGSSQMKIKRMSMNDIIRIINAEDNIRLLHKVYNR